MDGQANVCGDRGSGYLCAPVEHSSTVGGWAGSWERVPGPCAMGRRGQPGPALGQSGLSLPSSPRGHRTLVASREEHLPGLRPGCPNKGTSCGDLEMGQLECEKWRVRKEGRLSYFSQSVPFAEAWQLHL